MTQAMNARNCQMLIPNLFVTMLFTLVFLLSSQISSLAFNVQLNWNPNTEQSLAGYNIYYKSDSSTPPFNGTGAAEGNSPVNARNVTSKTITGLDPTKTYHFAITAYDSTGAESPFSDVVTLEAVPPTISIASPYNSSSASGTVLVSATASDNVGISKVEFYVNNVLQATDISVPYLYSWNTTTLADGTYMLAAKAYDESGNIGQSSTITVSVVKDTMPPTVSVTYPANNSTVSGTSTISASASDNVIVNKVEFYENGSLLCSTNVTPYSCAWKTDSVDDGIHILTAKAYDKAGNVGQSSNVSITVLNNTILGDINGDKKIDIIDALMALRFAVSLVHPTSYQLTCGDVSPVANNISTPDGKIDITDALSILKAAIELISFQIETNQNH